MLCSVSRTGFLFSSPYRSSTNISERLKHKACFTKHVSWSRPWICRRCEVFCNKSTNGSRTSTDFADITEQNRKKVLNLYEMYGLQSAAAYSLSLDKSHIASAVLLNLLVQLCCREGDVVFALKVAEELTKRGQATSFTFREIVRFFIRQRNLAGVQYIWKYCSQTGIEKDFVMYSCYVYCLVVLFQTNLFHFKAVSIGLLENYKGFRVPVITFNIFLDFFGRRRSRREVEEILYLMESDGIEPDRVTYNTLIKAYGYMRRHDLAEAAFKQQTSKFGPQLVGFNTLMNGYCEDKKFSRVLELFAQLKELGLKPDVKTYSTIIKGQIASGENPDTVMYWYGQMKDENITPDLKLAYSVLTFCTRKLCIEGVCLVLNDIRNIQNPLDAAIIQYFMDNLRNIPGSWEKQFEEWKG
ncbi:Putative pentatricopeptide repeat-containing protein mitochondrial [Galdieria sulphuraria]|nr:Putative pentatricopeptide repeat-containing protein mitochondrial [Galdieria sulphuraria]